MQEPKRHHLFPGAFQIRIGVTDTGIGFMTAPEYVPDPDDPSLPAQPARASHAEEPQTRVSRRSHRALFTAPTPAEVSQTADVTQELSHDLRQAGYTLIRRDTPDGVSEYQWSLPVNQSVGGDLRIYSRWTDHLEMAIAMGRAFEAARHVWGEDWSLANPDLVDELRGAKVAGVLPEPPVLAFFEGQLLAVRAPGEPDCLQAGVYRVVYSEDGEGLAVRCSHGSHYLSQSDDCPDEDDRHLFRHPTMAEVEAFTDKEADYDGTLLSIIDIPQSLTCIACGRDLGERHEVDCSASRGKGDRVKAADAITVTRNLADDAPAILAAYFPDAGQPRPLLDRFTDGQLIEAAIDLHPLVSAGDVVLTVEQGGNGWRFEGKHRTGPLDRPHHWREARRGVLYEIGGRLVGRLADLNPGALALALASNIGGGLVEAEAVSPDTSRAFTVDGQEYVTTREVKWGKDLYAILKEAGTDMTGKLLISPDGQALGDHAAHELADGAIYVTAEFGSRVRHSPPTDMAAEPQPTLTGDSVKDLGDVVADVKRKAFAVGQPLRDADAQYLRPGDRLQVLYEPEWDAESLPYGLIVPYDPGHIVAGKPTVLVEGKAWHVTRFGPAPADMAETEIEDLTTPLEGTNDEPEPERGTFEAVIARQAVQIGAAQKALARIERWFGEFPATGRFMGEGEDRCEMSYGVAFGSNGERDYMRGVARDALEAIRAAPFPGDELTTERPEDPHVTVYLDDKPVKLMPGTYSGRDLYELLDVDSDARDLFLNRSPAGALPLSDNVHLDWTILAGDRFTTAVAE